MYSRHEQIVRVSTLDNTVQSASVGRFGPLGVLSVAGPFTVEGFGAIDLGSPGAWDHISAVVEVMPFGAQVADAGDPNRVLGVGWFAPGTRDATQPEGSQITGFDTLHWIEFDRYLSAVDSERNFFDVLIFSIRRGGRVTFTVA